MSFLELKFHSALKSLLTIHLIRDTLTALMTTTCDDVDGGDVGYWPWSIEDNFPCDYGRTSFPPTREDVQFVLRREDARIVIRRVPSRARHLQDVFMVSVGGSVFYMTRQTGEASFRQSFCGSRGRRRTLTSGTIELPEQFLPEGTYNDVEFSLERRELYVRRHTRSLFGTTYWLRIELPEDFWSNDLFSGECRTDATITGRIWLEPCYELNDDGRYDNDDGRYDN